MAACPDGIRVTDGNTGQTVAFKKPWADCVPNALNTVPFANPNQVDDANMTTPETNYMVETDLLQITLSDQLRYTTAVSEIQIWVEPNMGPRYEAEDGVIGTFVANFASEPTGLNGTVENGGVTLHNDAWVEIAGVRRSDNLGGRTSVTLVGGGQGTVEVTTNWLKTQTVSFSGSGNKTLDVDMLRGGNVVTIHQTDGMPFIDALIVGS